MIYQYLSLFYTFNSSLYMSLSFCPSVILPGIAQTNDTIKKKEIVTSHLPLIHPNPPFHPRLPSQMSCSQGSIPMTAPTQTPQMLPSPKDGEYNYQTFSNPIRVASEKNPRRELYPNLVQREAKKTPAPLGRSDPALKFSTAYIIISPIWTTSVFLVT